MSTQAETNKSGDPESPTTARPLELDDDDVQEIPLGDDAGRGGTTNTSAGTPVKKATAENPPPQPQRPLTDKQKNEMMLKEAFPTVDMSVIRAVLSASNGQVEPAFNALLEMTDPDAGNNERQDENPPPPPPRPANNSRSQLEADEQYARQLAEHYNNVSAYEARTRNPEPGVYQHNRGFPPRQTSRAPPPSDDTEYNDRDYSFIDDDLPVIRENLRRGFVETQTKVNSWIQNFKKKIDETFEDDPEDDEPQGRAGPGSFSAARGQGPPSRRSGDYDRYDADPEVLGDDFAGMKLAADGSAIRDTRTDQNNNLFRPPPVSPKADSRKVSFQEVVDEDELYDASPRGPTAPKASTKASKWQPMSTVDPHPVAENDPFSLGDSDDDKDVGSKEAGHKSGASKDGIKPEESERLKQAAAEAMSDSIVYDKPKETDAKKD